MQVRIGIFVVPDATDPASTVGQMLAADETGLDFVGVQDHPYQGRFFDTWTLLGAYGPRMLRLTGRLADGWLPSLGGHYLTPEDVPQRQAAIDEAARAAGRDPGDIERAVNVMGLEGTPASWAQQLARIATDLHFSTLLVGVPDDDPIGFIRRLGEDTAPTVRELAS